MNVTIKIIVLVIAITLAIGGVMIYAKTKVEPPVATKSIDQFSKNLDDCFKNFAGENTPLQEDSIFATTINKINIYCRESKMEEKTGDANIDKLLSRYSPLFMKRSFAKFNQSTWYETDHSYMISVISNLRSIKHSDNSPALQKQTADSLATIERVISKYKQARAVSRRTGFNGVSNAQATISQAHQFANDNYLSHCSDLVSALNNVRPSIAQAHYNYISNMVEKLAQYRSYNQYYYENTLIPQVDAAVTEYDNNASDLYGSKRDVNSLWNKARSYYNSASQYYNN